ncbi:hypothetical protein H4R35_006730, partial [Dimargaris xerosporica]
MQSKLWLLAGLLLLGSNLSTAELTDSMDESVLVQPPEANPVDSASLKSSTTSVQSVAIPASRHDLESWYVDLGKARQHEPNVWLKTFQQYGLTIDTVRLFFRLIVDTDNADGFESMLFYELKRRKQHTALLSALVGYTSNAKVTAMGVEMYNLKDAPLNIAYGPQFIWSHLLEYAVIQDQPQLSTKVLKLVIANEYKRIAINNFKSRAMILDIYKTLFRYSVAYDYPEEVEELLWIAKALRVPLEMFYTTMYAWSVALDNEVIRDELEAVINYGILRDLQVQMHMLGMHDASYQVAEILREKGYSPIRHPTLRSPEKLLLYRGFQIPQIENESSAEALRP